ncbi:MAG: MutS-related protein [Syntrophobacteraceae bacterium]
MDYSILFGETVSLAPEEILDEPRYFVDLNLDRVIEAITAGRDEYTLKPFFYAPLKDVDSIAYRHEVFRDLEDKSTFEHIKSFSEKMRTMRGFLRFAEKFYYKLQKQRYFLDAVEIFCDTVIRLAQDLSRVELKSRGLSAFRDYLAGRVESENFSALLSETKRLEAEIASLEYCMHIEGGCVSVRLYDSEIDYSSEVEKTFDKFRQEAVRNYRTNFPDLPEMNHVEARVLDLVAKWRPDLFSNLEDYCAKNNGFLDDTIARFDREIQFYLACLEHVGVFEKKGLRFCYPQIRSEPGEVFVQEGFDPALANKLVAEGAPVICNDFFLKGGERVFVVSGPNQGGKTTFARMFGQLHYLGVLGCPVPGREAALYLFDRIFTHFEKEEDIRNLRGKLEDDLVRIHAILEEASTHSIIIMNEIFTSTTLSDATFLSKMIMERIMRLDGLCVWVTFIDELASWSEKTVSMVSTVIRENPALRTFRVVRRRADGLAYAMSLAEKHRVTYGCLVDRIR